jgi:hypothetical protein
MEEQGQINSNTKRWELIQKTIKENDFKTIVEIGTWKGMGSTLAVLTSKKENTKFITLESSEDFYNIAKKNLLEYENEFDLLYGKIVEIDDVYKFVENYKLNTEESIWLQNDITNFKKCPTVIDKIPEKIDFLILDGGEFSTYEEWIKLKNRVSFVALDDIQVMKSKKIYSELLLDSGYELINLTDEGHGFCVFKKVNL